MARLFGGSGRSRQVLSRTSRGKLAAALAVPIGAIWLFGGGAPTTGAPASGPVRLVVQEDDVRCHEEPEVNASTVETLKRGEPVDILDTAGKWSKVEHGRYVCWVPSRVLGQTAAPAAAAPARPLGLSASRSYATGSSMAATPRPSSGKRKRRAKSATGSSFRGTTGGSCPCNGGSVCVGPRGGRYCITSGGSKRYGV